MTDTELALPFEAGTLVIEAGTRTTTGDQWCPVYLEMNGARRRLGAQSLSYLSLRLLSFLDRKAMEYSHVEGLSKLRLQDHNAVFFATLILTAADRETWRQRLAAFQRSGSGAQA